MVTMPKLKVINLIGGPGCGKSTVAYGLSHLMKANYKNMEYCSEFAKDLTWDRSFDVLNDQLYILANQNRKLHRLVGQVDWVVVDSPIILSLYYVQLARENNPGYLNRTFSSLVTELWNQYDNYTFFLDRKFEYQTVGRNQTEAEAKKIDQSLITMLDEHGIPFTRLPSSFTTAPTIYHSLFEGSDGRA